uniref:Uncharacterized protein n=1 Tax=Anguilla anguilla TaxID=7936 RepID=A0A0E9Q828_ANGAN
MNHTKFLINRGNVICRYYIISTARCFSWTLLARVTEQSWQSC